METKRDVYLSLLVNISSQHYAGFSSPYVEDRDGGEVLPERDHLQRPATRFGIHPSSANFILKCPFRFSQSGNN